ncbi:DUF3180 domain-containing protein [Demetria terragena]|uniref:DUF3180 domain-containing protein n=1 Tax=Demetria terragena TaxID=63959 RepID=UPI00037F17EC|nr:DUF3180 domain-containing protein [Demetria terragena]
MTEDSGLKARTVVFSGGIALALSYFLLRVLSDRGVALPRNSWFTVAIIVLVAVGLLSCAWSIRSYVEGKNPEPPTPQFGRGVLVAARACALTGGVVAGFYAGEALIRMPNAAIPSQASAMWLALVLTAVSLGLASAGLVAQSWCRIPPQDDDEQRA